MNKGDRRYAAKRQQRRRWLLVVFTATLVAPITRVPRSRTRPIDKDGPFRKLLSSLLSKRATSSTRNPRYHEVKCHLKKLALSARETKIHEIRLLYATSQFLGTCIRVIVALGNSFTFLQNFFSLFVNLSLFFARYFYNSCIQFLVYRYRCAWELDQVEISETRRQGGEKSVGRGRNFKERTRKRGHHGRLG